MDQREVIRKEAGGEPGCSRLKAVVCASYALAVLPNPSTSGSITHWDFLANGGRHLMVDT